MKIAPLWRQLKDDARFSVKIIHTGQHYSPELSDFIFRDLGLPKPDFQLSVGSGSHVAQTAKVMMEYERLLLNKNLEKPDLVIVPGDVNSTLACALAAKQCGLKVAHLEAGLRSFDLSMPEELNRIVVDRISDILWTPSPDADENLKREGISSEKISRVGNIMIDAIEMLRGEILRQPLCADDKSLEEKNFILATFHRPSNVDDSGRLRKILELLNTVAQEKTVIFPIHPRTQVQIQEHFPNLLAKSPHLITVNPLAYLRFMRLLSQSALVLTDSGGIQEESTYFGVPCLTLRENTERPITITEGTNRLVSIDISSSEVLKAMEVQKQKKSIEYWDGRTAQRIVDSLL